MFRKTAVTACIVILMFSAQVFADVIDGENLVDPTRPFAIENVDNSSMVQELIRTVIPASYDVSFIRAGSNLPMAVINQQRVTIGDVIGGAEVTAIDRDGVTLLVDGEERRISLYDVSVKTISVSQ